MFYPKHPSRGLGTKFGGPGKVLLCQCFFTGNMVPPGTSASVTEVEFKDNWFKDRGRFALVNTSPLDKLGAKKIVGMVLSANDGRLYRIDAVTRTPARTRG